MKLNIKSDLIRRAINNEKRYSLFNRSMIEASEIYGQLPAEDVAYSILWGYISSIVEISDTPQVKAPIDLTYNTVKNLPYLAGYAFVGSRCNRDSDAICIDTAEKTIAAYLYFLAANEHNTKILVNIPGTGKWADYFDISAQSLFAKADFLSDMKGQVVLVKDDLLEIHMDKVINSYKIITGIDLKDHGVDSMRGKLPPRI